MFASSLYQYVPEYLKLWKLLPRNQRSRLCRRCRQLDPDVVFDMDTMALANELLMTPYILLDGMNVSPYCALCSLFQTLRFNRQARYEVRRFTLEHYLKAPCEDEAPTKSRVLLGAVPEHEYSKTENCLLTGIVAKETSESCDGIHHDHDMHGVNPVTPNYSQIKRWLDHCVENHATSCGLPKRHRDSTARCIDCRTMEIVSIEPSEKYFALSYVYGGNARMSRLNPHHPADPYKGISSWEIQGENDYPPQIVTDAINVVLNLGGRYLWVDKYGIDPQDRLLRNNQIRNMNRIYEGAFATIVAVESTSADDALPGVSAARDLQPLVRIGEHTLISTMANVSTIIQDSKWNTRGWTFQELILSRRCLFFTRQQVHFACRVRQCTEALDSFPPTVKSQGNDLMSANILGASFSTDKYSWDRDLHRMHQQFWRYLRYYRLRELTFKTDSLNAFQGLINNMRMKSVWGVPIVLIALPWQVSYTYALATGLFWSLQRLAHGTSSPARIPGLPSWSWAGWDRQLEPMDKNYYGTGYTIESVGQLDFFLHFKSGARIPIEDYCSRPNFMSDILPMLECQGTCIKFPERWIEFFRRAEFKDYSVDFSFPSIDPEPVDPLFRHDRFHIAEPLPRDLVTSDSFFGLELFENNRRRYSTLLLLTVDNKTSVVGWAELGPNEMKGCVREDKKVEIF